MDYNVKSSHPEEVHEKIKANYAGIISRKMTVPPYEGRTYFEIMYFDDKEKDWHIGYGSFSFEYVQTWLDEEFEPTYKRLDEAITDLLARAKAAEARCNLAEKCFDNSALHFCETQLELEKKARAEAEARAEKAERERDAAIKELDGVAAAVDDLSDFIDEQIHPLVQYDIYLALRENADAISMWQYEAEWRSQKEEKAWSG